MSHVRVLDKLAWSGMPWVYQDRTLELFLLGPCPPDWASVAPAIRRSNARVRERLRRSQRDTERITR